MTDLDMANNGDMFSNVFSYLGAPLCSDIKSSDADVAILGLPYDLATSGRAGTRSGPMAIRQASANLRWEESRWPWEFALLDRLKIADCGDVNFHWGNHEDFVNSCQQRASEIIDAGKTLISLGGDHYVALPLLRSHVARHGKVALIHFDAHTDTDEEGWIYDHGAMFHHACSEGLLDEERSVQVGIRTEYKREGHPFTVLDADWVSQRPATETCARIHEIVGAGPAYLTFDIDCLDPAFAPGTGTPVCGGLSSNHALQIVRGLKGLNLVGMDLVEVAPAYDHSDVTALAGATLVLEFLHLIGAQKPG